MLEYAQHREGIWDAQIAAQVARKVMEIEEGNTVLHLGTSRGSSIGDNTLIGDNRYLRIPEQYRLHDVEAEFEGEPVCKVVVFCKMRQIDTTYDRTCIGEYDLGQHSWSKDCQGEC